MANCFQFTTLSNQIHPAAGNFDLFSSNSIAVAEVKYNFSVAENEMVIDKITQRSLFANLNGMGES